MKGILEISMVIKAVKDSEHQSTSKYKPEGILYLCKFVFDSGVVWKLVWQSIIVFSIVLVNFDRRQRLELLYKLPERHYPFLISQP